MNLSLKNPIIFGLIILVSILSIAFIINSLLIYLKLDQVYSLRIIIGLIIYFFGGALAGYFYAYFFKEKINGDFIGKSILSYIIWGFVWSILGISNFEGMAIRPHEVLLPKISMPWVIILIIVLVVARFYLLMQCLIWGNKLYFCSNKER